MTPLDQIPPPTGFGPGRWVYVDWNPAPVWQPDALWVVNQRARRFAQLIIGGWIVAKFRAAFDWLVETIRDWF